MRIALVGQPNSGRSTLFNAVAGYRTEVANLGGTTLEVTRSDVHWDGRSFELVEVPGIYSLRAGSEGVGPVVDSLRDLAPDVVIDVADASILSRSLELTLELLELELPLVLCLNMIDEAERKGIQIDAERLSRELGVPVVPTVATHGQGILELFRTALATAGRPAPRQPIAMSRDVESTISELATAIGPAAAARVGLPARFLALRLLERDEAIRARVTRELPEIGPLVDRLAGHVADAHGRPSQVVVTSERHAVCMNLFEEVATVRAGSRRTKRDHLDRYATHRVWGYLILAGVLVGFFFAVFALGGALEPPILGLFERLQGLLASHLPAGGLARTLLTGLVQGFAGGIGIVLPYLVPFLVGMAILEDVGYIPRAAFLMDTLMHRIGLHGKAIIPFALGYGCTVPAIMSTRVLENARDRYVTALLVNLIPCAARTTVIFAVVGFFMGAGWALAFYAIDLVVVAVAGRLLLRFRRREHLGLILEMPAWRLPALPALANKVWFRLREFIFVAWPILIAGSLLLSLLEHLRLGGAVNGALAPLTSGLLGLPAAVGLTLLFGILRKELTIVMLVQALGTSNLASVMTTEQMAVFTAFSLFYVPCLATLAMVRSAIGGKAVIVTIAFTTGVAIAVALLFRLAFGLLA